jgi:hypothetical protein
VSSVILTGDTSGTLTVSAPAVAGSNTVTLPAQTGTLQTLGVGTAVASTSGTSIDFTSIPSWVKRITVMFDGVSTNGSSFVLVQIGSGSITTSGYVSGTWGPNSAGSSTAGFLTLNGLTAADLMSGILVINLIGSNTYIQLGNINREGSGCYSSAGRIALGGTLDRIRITTVSGTSTFDAGSINIMYEG